MRDIWKNRCTVEAQGHRKAFDTARPGEIEAHLAKNGWDLKNAREIAREAHLPGPSRTELSRDRFGKLHRIKIEK